MSITDYIESINKAFEKKYPNKGFFVVTLLLLTAGIPIYKTYNVHILHFPSKDIVFTFSYTDKVSAQDIDKFKTNCWKEIISTITELIDKLWEYGTKS